MAVENTEAVHYMVVCTLCSCYPRALLGPPPDWYKSLPYRSRAISDPRGVLTEFGVELDDDVELRVLDSTADIRYLVIPRRPPGNKEINEQQLAAWNTRRDDRRRPADRANANPHPVTINSPNRRRRTVGEPRPSPTVAVVSARGRSSASLDCSSAGPPTQSRAATSSPKESHALRAGLDESARSDLRVADEIVELDKYGD